MPPKKIAPNTERGYIGDVKYKPKPKKVFIEDEWIVNYRLERDRIIYKATKDEQTRADILEKYKK
jgi:hypothetical protein